MSVEGGTSEKNWAHAPSDGLTVVKAGTGFIYPLLGAGGTNGRDEGRLPTSGYVRFDGILVSSLEVGCGICAGEKLDKHLNDQCYDKEVTVEAPFVCSSESFAGFSIICACNLTFFLGRGGSDLFSRGFLSSIRAF